MTGRHVVLLVDVGVGGHDLLQPQNDLMADVCRYVFNVRSQGGREVRDLVAPVQFLSVFVCLHFASTRKFVLFSTIVKANVNAVPDDVR